jgi:hypothetical protein
MVDMCARERRRGTNDGHCKGSDRRIVGWMDGKETINAHSVLLNSRTRKYGRGCRATYIFVRVSRIVIRTTSLFIVHFQFPLTIKRTCRLIIT